MSKVLCLLNHPLTPKQKDELISSFQAKQIIIPPPDLKNTWSSIPTTPTLNQQVLSLFASWIDYVGKPGDYLVIQGEYGSTFYLVQYAFYRGIVPLHSVTERQVIENREGETTYKSYVFNHQCFRKYLEYLP